MYSYSASQVSIDSDFSDVCNPRIMAMGIINETKKVSGRKRTYHQQQRSCQDCILLLATLSILLILLKQVVVCCPRLLGECVVGSRGEAVLYFCELLISLLLCLFNHTASSTTADSSL